MAGPVHYHAGQADRAQWSSCYRACQKYKQANMRNLRLADIDIKALLEYPETQSATDKERPASIAAEKSGDSTAAHGSNRSHLNLLRQSIHLIHLTVRWPPKPDSLRVVFAQALAHEQACAVQPRIRRVDIDAKQARRLPDGELAQVAGH